MRYISSYASHRSLFVPLKDCHLLLAPDKMFVRFLYCDAAGCRAEANSDLNQAKRSDFDGYKATAIRAGKSGVKPDCWIIGKKSMLAGSGRAGDN
ncbi:MAG: hypothetical protein VX970_10335 [Planctomycetota bacterium]|nr:hypothetical protein [Planctomycetota bacterium]